MPREFKYDVAFSFAGSDREVARAIASIASYNGLKVFLDEQHLWESWGRNLNEYLGAIYDGEARYCVVLISADYCDKAYTNFERRRALDRALDSRAEYILPVRIDDSWLDGLPRATAYLDLRQMSLVDVGSVLVRKVKGANAEVLRPDPISGPTVHADPGAVIDQPARGAAADPLTFARIAVAAECQAWKEDERANDDEVLVFRGGFGWYEDPIFDLVIVNRGERPVLLTAVGIETVGLGCKGVLCLGGGGAAPLDLQRTYQLQLPDLWRVLAQRVRDVGEEAAVTSRFAERGLCRLADPVWIEPDQPYRYGLHLVDYTSFCPTEVDLHFVALTDRGESRSARCSLRYVIGGDIAPLERYRRMLDEAESEDQKRRVVGNLNAPEREGRLRELAYRCWERAGCPAGRDQEFWAQAQASLGTELLAKEDLRGVHGRPLRLPSRVVQ